MNPHSKEVVKAIWLSNDLPESFLRHLVLEGDADSAINSSFRIGTAAQAAVALAGLSAAYLHWLRTGIEQDVTVNARHAVLSFHSEAWYTIDGKLPSGDLWDNIAGLYKTKDGGFVRLHTNFPHHRKGILSILDIPDTAQVTREHVAEAVLKWDAVEFESVAAENGMCATALRSFVQWDQHPHARALLGTPPVVIKKIADAPKRQVEENLKCPLDGIRVLDLSRVLAGPIAGRTLAGYGADVLLISSPNLPSLPALDVETSLGKRTAQLDLNDSSSHRMLMELGSGSDVFMQAYRPGGLEAKNFGVKDLASLRPGIVYASLTAWGWDGPWKSRRGFDSLVQTATGFNFAEGEVFHAFQGSPAEPVKPRPLPMQAIDHASGYLLAFGINTALAKTITEGGSWEVRVSLASVGQWVRNLGRLSPNDAFGVGRPFPSRKIPPEQEIAELAVDWRETDNKGRSMTAISHPAILSVSTVKEGTKSEAGAPMSLAAHDPVWRE